MMDKNGLRNRLKTQRKEISYRHDRDVAVIQQLHELDVFKNAKVLLCYLSLPEEIDTTDLIEFAWKQGKTVAVPYCTDGDGNMDFYLLNSFSDLNTGSLGVREPDIAKTDKITDFSQSVCIVPGISFDRHGNRLGYGKGYYDRFLKNYSSISIGLCYNSLIQNELPVDGHDVPVDMIITETRIIGGKNG